MSNRKTAALIVAAGRGTRAVTDEAQAVPKQYRPVAGQPLLRRTLRAFENHPGIAMIQAVIRPDDADLYGVSAKGLQKTLPPVHGGAERQDSVRAGLEALLDHGVDDVLIHDAARPLVSAGLISRVCGALTEHKAVLPVLTVTDTVKSVDESGLVTGTLKREVLRRAQTPQGFHYKAIQDAHLRAADGRSPLTDDAAVAEAAGIRIMTVEGDTQNIKVTMPADFEEAERLLAGGGTGTIWRVRTGLGFDVHAFAPGDAIILGGVSIPHDRRLAGHSDADVLLHAITDALFGAIADGDIGSHFPPSDPQWKGADSTMFLAHAAKRLKAAGGVIEHIDTTVICEAPKIGPHREAIRTRIAELLNLDIGAVGVKATTTERLGFTGRGEGIAAQAIATVRLPEKPDG